MKKGYLIGGVVFLLASVLVAWVSLRNLNLAQSSNDWVKTSGKIVGSELQDFSVGRKENFKALIEYSYTIDGSIHRGTRIRFADTTGSAEATQRALVEQYPVNATVDVYYDPHHPSEAVLEPGGGLRSYALMLPPLLLAGIGMILLNYGRRKTLGQL